ncbi:MAG: flagellar brake protein [Candidatus Velthaea sp.]
MPTLLRVLGLKPKPPANDVRTKLPALHSFMDVSSGSAPAVSASLDAIAPRSLSIAALPGLAPGATAVFVYNNAAGKFRFTAKCTQVKGRRADFALPARIETLKTTGEGEKRTTVRLDATVPAQWRYAVRGKGNGEFMRGSLTDISRTGASLIADRQLVKGTHLEVRFSLNSGTAPLELLGEVMRCTTIERSGKSSLGLRFHGVSHADDRAIMDFINKRQAERRSRGLA